MVRDLTDEDPLAPPPPHVHEWKETMHLDGCHSYQSYYQCDCGAVRMTWAERQLEKIRGIKIPSPMMLPESCYRCKMLMDGNRRRPRRDQVIEPNPYP